MRRLDSASAGRPLGGDRGTAGQTRDDTASIADAGSEGKQDFGTCIGCGIRIAPSVSSSMCGTCRAWHRWYISHRIASRYLRAATR